ncbi:MAG: DUF4114 domain-containing protein [Deltaproteobacteria bacterium]|nr:DUF4114 domain-containing protein [Deltaproteobacteria bacterium]
MSFRLASWLLVLSAAVTLASSAAALKQPNDVTIPVGSGLQSLFVSRGEAIDALADAQAKPETFTPTCKLSFEVLQRNADYKNAFGWYNVTGAKPGLAELHEFLKCNDPVGTTKVLNIKKDPAYLGGDIGFFQATGGCGSVQSHEAIFFSEKKYNPDGNQQNPFIHLLIYNSTVVPKAFYFGWEDLLTGGDNDFDDLTTFVSGIGCTGSGASCATGQLGVCADGSLQCQSGALACVPLATPSTEVCDGLDNDCSGVVDEGNLCADKKVCDKGKCVPKCGGGEFTCADGTVCDSKGLCVEPGCLDVTCPANATCDGGKCVGPCDGVACPFGEVCLSGTCVDPCTKFTCDPEQVCVLGACVERCECAGCAKDATCQSDGRCLPNACLNKSCPPGTHCDALGNCEDDCAGATCPKGQLCQEGACVADPNAGQGGQGGGASGTGNFVGSGGAGGSGSTSSVSGAGGGGALGRDDAGCGCHVPASEDDARCGALAVLALTVAAARRRRGERR